MKKISYEKLRIGLKKRQRHNINRTALSRILTIEPRLHRIILSSVYTYEQIENAVGELKILDKAGSRRPNYQKKASRQWKGLPKGLTIFFNQREGYLPNSMIEFTIPDSENNPKKVLSEIAEKLPKQNISKIEYTVDLFVDEPKHARFLFNIFWIYLCPPYQRGVEYKKGRRAKYRKITVMAIIKNRLKKLGLSFKIYERGKDCYKNKNNRWNFKNLDRLRLEFTASRKSRNLKGLNTLEDLIKNPQFTQMMKDKIRFKRAKSSSKLLPKEWEAYKSQDELNNKGSFFIEHRKALANYGNKIYQQEEIAIEFNNLVEIITFMMDWFNKNWHYPTPKPSIDFDNF